MYIYSKNRDILKIKFQKNRKKISKEEGVNETETVRRFRVCVS